MYTKAEAIEIINRCATEYLDGFPVEMSGIRSKKVAILSRMALDYSEMAELHRKYKQAVTRYTTQQIMYFHISQVFPADYQEMRGWADKAMQIWERRY